MAKARQFPRNKSTRFEFFLLKTSRVAVILFSKLASACDFAVARYNTITNQLRLKAAAGSLREEDVEEVNRALAP